MNAIVVNCSAPYYNLGAHKLADWLRTQDYEVTYYDGDGGMLMGKANLVCLSVVFSWDAPVAREIALRVHGESEVWCGGPGMYALVKWWEKETGLPCQAGLDMRFERQRGKYQMTFASRGCPVGCWFCIVPKIEGKTFTLDWNFTLAPMLCDNNLSALPYEFQSHIVQRYQAGDVKLRDANSGFEPRTFTEDTYLLWKSIVPTWRFALDETEELEDVRRMMHILHSVPASHKRVYVLIGNEPIDSCYERVRKVIEWGGEPYCQPVMPLNALSRDDLIVRYDWTQQKLKDMARWVNKWLWRNIPLADYRPRKYEQPPFYKFGNLREEYVFIPFHRKSGLVNATPR